MDLARIDVPTLLVAAQDSPPMFRRVTELMAAAIPRSRIMHVPGGHLINPGQPEVLAFVTEILPRPARRSGLTSNRRAGQARRVAPAE